MTNSNQLLIHLVSRITSDLEFLSTEGLISQNDFNLIKSKLPSTTNSDSTNDLNGGISNLAITYDTADDNSRLGSGSGSNVVEIGRERKVIAIWTYEGTHQDDLSFISGDIINITEQMNDQWARGNCNGRSGLFPTNHVEPFNSAPPLPPRTNSHISNFQNNNNNNNNNNNFSAPSPIPSPIPYHNQKYPSSAPSTPYYQSSNPYDQPQSFPPSPQIQNQLPSNSQYQSYHPSGLTPYQQPQLQPQSQSQSQQLQAPQDQQSQPQQQQQTNGNGTTNGPPAIPKKPRFGKFGNQMASSFAGGIGFGAGMAIATDVVHAIL